MLYKLSMIITGFHKDDKWQNRYFEADGEEIKESEAWSDAILVEIKAPHPG